MKKILLIILLLTASIYSQRIKDISHLKGATSVQLMGYGLVVGLAGTGDSYRSSFTTQSVTSMLKQFGITVPQTNLRTRNVAAVMVTATVTNYLKPGSKYDINISALGDATSLLGGTLLMTPMLGIDRQVYGFSQGAISVGGYDFNTASGSRLVKNHALTGRIPNGGILEFDLGNPTINQTTFEIILSEPDFTTAFNIATEINNKFGENTASAKDATEIIINVPADRQSNFISFLSELETIEVTKDVSAKVVLNERTGTVVAGNTIKIAPVTITHGNLNITIKSYPIISQPNPFTDGSTVVFNNLVPSVEQEDNNVYAIEGASNVQEVAAALNSLKVSPRDIIAIFQALKEAGALTAELVII